MENKSDMTHALLTKLLIYTPETGLFSRPSGIKAGSITTQGHIQIRLLGVRYQAHRLAWFYTHGTWPLHDIDHINGNRSDNRISNLREATRTQNLANRSLLKSNSSGYQGVSWIEKKQKWRALIRKEGRLIHIGYFSTAEKASAAYQNAFNQIFGSSWRRMPPTIEV